MDPSAQSAVYLQKGTDSRNIPIVLDTGASFSLTPVLSDFVSAIEKCPTKEMTGLTDSVMIVGVGDVEWAIRDHMGQVQIIRTKSYYIPKASVRLFSPQSYFRQHADDGLKDGEVKLNHE